MKLAKQTGRMVSVASLTALCGWAGASTAYGQGPGTEFRDLVGVNNRSQLKGVLTDKTLSSGRSNRYISWSNLQPSESSPIDDSQITKWINYYHNNNQRLNNSDEMALLAYDTNWAADTSDRRYQFQGYDFHITNNNGQLHLSGGPRPRDLDSRSKLSIAPEHVGDWKNYVSHVSTRLHDAGVTYFQPWNEPNGWGFYIGDMDLPGHGGDADAAPIAVDSDANFYNLIHKPAAEAIHAAGGKVVFGGWPTPKPISDYADWLDYHTTPDPTDKQDAWDNIDVLDMHYRQVSAMELIRQRAAAAGHPDIGIWQTEVGDTTQAGYLPSFYPRFAHWALKHNDGDPDRYRAYIFPYAGAGDVEAKSLIGSHSNLTSDHLTRNGLAMQTMGELLGGGKMEIYDPVRNDRGIGLSLVRNESSVESFKIDDRIVVAVHLDDNEDKSDDTIKLFFDELSPDEVASAMRVTPFGDVMDILDSLEELDDGGISLTVPTDDIRRPLNDGKYGGLVATSKNAKTLFVRLGVVPEPSSLALVGVAGVGLLMRRRHRGLTH